MSSANAEQVEAWNGYEGRHWAEHADRYDAVNGGYNDALLDAAAIRDGDRVLDVGCGNGQVALLAARRAGSGSVLGLDLSRPMLGTARARAAAAHLENVAFEQGDAQVHPLPEGAFDVVVSRFGVMFFSDPVAAFTRLCGALRPGGRLAFVCLRELGEDGLGRIFAAMEPHLPRPTGPDGTGPTSFADPARVHAVLTAAGFADVVCAPTQGEAHWGRDLPDAADFLAAWGPVRFHLDRADPGQAVLAREALTGALAEFVTPEGVRTRGDAWLVTARRPGGTP